MQRLSSELHTRNTRRARLCRRSIWGTKSIKRPASMYVWNYHLFRIDPQHAYRTRGISTISPTFDTLHLQLASSDSPLPKRLRRTDRPLTMAVHRGRRLKAVIRKRLNNLRICPQGIPAWSAVQAPFLTSVALGTEYYTNQTYVAPRANSSSPVPPSDPRESEDCLFLDVFVPEKVMAKATQGYAPLTPVLVWIYVSCVGLVQWLCWTDLDAGRRIHIGTQERPTCWTFYRIRELYGW